MSDIYRNNGISPGASRFSTVDNSSNAAKSSDEKNSSEEYAYIERDGEEENSEDFRDSKFVDKSAQLSAELKSLAMINIASVMRNNKLRKSDIKS